MADLVNRLELNVPLNVCINICRTAIIMSNGRISDARPLDKEPVLAFSLPPNLRDFIPVKIMMRPRRLNENTTELMLTASQAGFAGPARMKSLELSLGKVGNIIACEYEKYTMGLR